MSKRSIEVLSILLAGAAALTVSERSALAQGASPDAPPSPVAAPVAPVAPVALAPAAAPAAPAAPPGADSGPTATPAAPAEKVEKKPLPWHGTYLLFDQSATTQTVGLGSDYQSADPVYEWWFRFAPKYYFYESKTENVTVNAWFNLYHEFTNSDSTTYRNETVLGGTSLWLAYGRQLYKDKEWVTSMNVAPVRLSLPTDKASRDSGNILGLGVSAGLSQSVPIQGKSASALNSARLGISAIYNHPFNKANVAVNPDLERVRQDTEGHSFSSDVLRSGMQTNHSLTVLASGGLQITPKLGFSLLYVWLNSWAYRPPTATVATMSGPVTDPTNNDATNFRVSTWFLGSFDYDLADEVSLSLGYYNLAGQIGPDGQRRNPLWSPEARAFFTITANLDAIYDRLSGRTEETSAKTDTTQAKIQQINGAGQL